ncbi:1-(5-phosphoribosyl)-5-[(5-phosphoribosylamino)methylideneamino] imidazole-4-carboxamide isomerase [Fulvivirgaceae bacterium BMA10]|uniref:1-(5-phosphoribosyl)-5-[(5-phosphoribosylamino)methylideneamino] imidazole-4-carboxamide isomerase n=1 Tax=Splendidivirga corallicola TaxID=3051826 RepID=A0ABT8KN19_9BACT|nr:1-(5-phosphoribosyl)-5-[(5-phosphoribosylamino)methylideneamino] imidazole-4-carboxamide isomerase [Fulvivirgaceae bacterium BMA10]
MIKIIPSIWVIQGKCVRVRQGDFSKQIIYNNSPLDVANEFEDHGVSQIHLVDLEGARRGSAVNYGVLEAIAGHTNLEIDFTGGIHTDGDISKAFEYGANYITAATIAVYNPQNFASWIISYGRENITLGADALERKIIVKGWQKNTSIDIFEHIEYFYSRGLKYVKTTDISRDGVMKGPSFDLYKELLEKFPDICLIASGGVQSVDDIKKLEELGVWGVHFGKAYYEGKINLKDLEQFLAHSS